MGAIRGSVILLSFVCLAGLASGATVWHVDVNGAGAAEVAKSLGKDALALTCDVSKSADVAAAVAAASAAFGRIDVLVNNAGASHVRQPMLDVGEDEFDRVFAVNVKSIYLFAKEVVPLFRRRGGGVSAQDLLRREGRCL